MPTRSSTRPVPRPHPPSPAGRGTPTTPEPVRYAGGISPTVPSTLRGARLPIHGAHVIWVTFLTVLPWAFVAVFDAIDHHLRSRSVVAARLTLTTACVAVAYFVGGWYVVELVQEDDRWDECATVLVAMFFNLWLVSRNLRGWTQLLALRRLDTHFTHMLHNFFISVPEESHRLASAETEAALLATPMSTLRISSALIDNNLTSPTPWLSPFDACSRTWVRAFWLAWWSQNPSQRQTPCPPATYDYTRHPVAYDLAEEHWPETVHASDGCQPGNPTIRTADEWVRALRVYGDEPVLEDGTLNRRFPGEHAGQQDTAGAVPQSRPLLDTSTLGGVATLVYEKTAHVPHIMSSLWYGTSTFSNRYAEAARRSGGGGHLRVPSLAQWRSMAVGIGERAPVPLYLSGASLENYACEMAAASMLLSLYAAPFKALVDQIYEDGRKARWTFGWSGLLSCFSNLWTRERVYVAAANGLSLLALQCAPAVGPQSAPAITKIPDCVRSLLVAYTSYAVSQRAVGRAIAPARQTELLRRYRHNKGRTCRGSGVDAIRRACAVLGLPAAASHMDGLPAFTAGWCLEYMVRQPGNQAPTHGSDHDEVERRLGSGTAWRYPSDCSFG